MARVSRRFAPIAVLVILLVACAQTPQVGSVAVTVTGLPDGVDGDVVVAGPDGFVQTLSATEVLTDLAPGSYTVEGTSVATAATSAFAATVTGSPATVVANRIAAVSVAYRVDSGSLEIAVTGLPASVAADVTVIGPDGFSATLAGPSRLTGLPPGSYSIGAEAVRSSDPIVDTIFEVAAMDVGVEVDSNLEAVATVAYAPRGGSGALWIPHWDTTAIVSGYDRAQLAHSMSGPPAVLLTGASEWRESGVFDAEGNLWLAQQVGPSVTMYRAADLETSGSPEASVSLTGLGAAWTLAFDPAGNLWLALGSNDLIMLTPEQIGSAGSPTPTVTIDSTVLSSPSGMAFDAAGDLWVANVTNDTVVMFSSAQLATSGTLLPAVVLDANAGSLSTPIGVAFDVAGNLWVANAGGPTVVRYTPAQLAVSGAPVPNVTLSSDGSSFVSPFGLAFDNSGNLWVANRTAVSSSLEMIAADQLSATGAPTPATTIDGFERTNVTGIAFSPPPKGLPINTP
jgi:sugar lactone lactonase YvrE